MSRPVTCGTGYRLSVYIPKALYQRLTNIVQELDGSCSSSLVQEALSRYLDDLECVISCAERGAYEKED